MSTRIVIADGYPVFLLGLVGLLSDHGKYHVAASCSEAEQTLQAVRSHRPDMLVLDLQLLECDRYGLLRTLQAECIELKVVVLASFLNPDDLLDLIGLGVRGVVLKSMPSELILRCLDVVDAGGEWLERRAASLALRELSNRGVQEAHIADALTDREAQLVRLVAEGLSNREIAARLFISEGTVKTHMHRIFDKLQVKNRVALTLLAAKGGWGAERRRDGAVERVAQGGGVPSPAAAPPSP